MPAPNPHPTVWRWESRVRVTLYDYPAEPIRFTTLAQSYEDGARRYREHAARQALEGRHDHAASSLLKAEHKERMARRYRALFA